jgi:threonine/homoserine/homoserine lactone efflux protein
MIAPGLAPLNIRSLITDMPGRFSAMKAILGVEAANLTFILFSAAGLTALLVACQPLFTAVRWAGALYLINLGLRLLRDAFRPPACTVEQPHQYCPRSTRIGKGLRLDSEIQRH